MTNTEVTKERSGHNAQKLLDLVEVGCHQCIVHVVSDDVKADTFVLTAAHLSW